MAWLTALLSLVFLLVVANGAPVLARRLTAKRWAWPIDGGRMGSDGRRLLGKSKTWRGLVASLLSTGLVSMGIGLGFWFGVIIAALAMAGDLISSYIKRRYGLPPSARATGLDQLPEAVLPMVVSHWWLDVGWALVIASSAIFFVLVTQLSPVLFRLGIRRRPH